jgi:hypothetical protein
MKDLTKLEEICEKYGNSKEVKDAVREAFVFKEDEFDKYHMPLWKVENFKAYKRHLIQLRPDVAILLHIFQRDIDKSLETCWLDDNDEYYMTDFTCIKDSAHQLLLQLEGHTCDAFIEALRNECNEILKNSEEKKAKIREKNGGI